SFRELESWLESERLRAKGWPPNAMRRRGSRTISRYRGRTMQRARQFAGMCMVLMLCGPSLLLAQSDSNRQNLPPRARDLGVPFDGTPGPLNAITDVAGVEVGSVTLIKGEGALKVGEGPVRTGVTVVLPRGAKNTDPVYAGWFSLNGNGEMTGTTWVEESGFLEGPVAITNTHSVGVVRDALIAWTVKRSTNAQAWALPVVAETWD